MLSSRQRSAEAAALDVLTEYGLERLLPIPVEDVAHRLDVIIRREQFNAEDVSGLLLREHGKRPIIGVNAETAPVRQRFTIAHELGHNLLHKGKRLVLDRSVRVNFRDSASSLATDREEMEANAFAAGLLMPADSVAEQLDRIVRGRPCSDDELVNRMARKYQVSRSAMEFRLINLGMLTPS